jgi:hypothetical protein
MTEGIQGGNRYSYMTWDYTKGTCVGSKLITLCEQGEIMSWKLIEGDK